MATTAQQNEPSAGMPASVGASAGCKHLLVSFALAAAPSLILPIGTLANNTFNSIYQAGVFLGGLLGAAGAISLGGVLLGGRQDLAAAPTVTLASGAAAVALGVSGADPALVSVALGASVAGLGVTSMESDAEDYSLPPVSLKKAAVGTLLGLALNGAFMSAVVSDVKSHAPHAAVPAVAEVVSAKSLPTPKA